MQDYLLKMVLKQHCRNKKDVKYIELTVRPYNRVGDKLSEARDVATYLVIPYMKVTFIHGTVRDTKM